MKRRFSRGLLAALIAGITLFYPLLAPTPQRIDEAHFKLIEKGMSLARVEAIFGVPPGEHDCAEFDTEAYQKRYRERFFTTGSQSVFDPTVGSTVVRYIYSPEGNCVGLVRIVASKNKLKRWTGRNGCVEIQFDDYDAVLCGSYHRDIRIDSPWQRAWRWWKSK